MISPPDPSCRDKPDLVYTSSAPTENHKEKDMHEDPCRKYALEFKDVGLFETICEITTSLGDSGTCQTDCINCPPFQRPDPP